MKLFLWVITTSVVTKKLPKGKHCHQEMQDLEQILSSRNLAFNIEIYIITKFGTVRKSGGHFEDEGVECFLSSVVNFRKRLH
jgi:hypothetical protein